MHFHAQGFTSHLKRTSKAHVDFPEGVLPYIHINQNEFWGLKQKKLKEEDISICECKYDANDPDSACGERCLNVLTSTECTSGYCPCGDHCKNQRFQKCEYAKTKLFKTEGRGWGLLADQDIKADQFIIEYCGEVISSSEAMQRSQTYEAQGLKDAYIISLNANYFIDATQKGSLARFINHSCQPNCETRKWTVLGETRVGIFAKQDISAGTELAYNYNFEWYGGVTVRCLCGAANCSIFLGAKSQGFQEYYHVWEDGDDRYTVDKIPLYDSAEDEPFAQIHNVATSSSEPKPLDIGENGYSLAVDGSKVSECDLDSSITKEATFPVPVEGMPEQPVKTEVSEETEFHTKDMQAQFSQMNAMISRIRSSSTCRNYNIGPGPTSKRKSHHVPKRSKLSGRKQVNAKNVAELFASEEVREEIRVYEEMKNRATSELNSLYDDIRPAIEEHERDNQDSVPTSVAEKWIGATCSKWKAEFDLYFSVVKNVMCPRQPGNAEKPPSGGDDQNEVKYLTN